MSSSELDMKMKILLAAKRLFARQGFEGTTVRQICEEAGANVALVSYYFGGKENVFAALFTAFYPGNRLQEFEPYFKDPITGLKKLVEEVIRLRFHDPELLLMIQHEILKNSPRIDVIRHNVFPVWRKLRELLEQGKQAGVFHYRSLDSTMFFVIGTLLFHHSTYFSPLLSEGEPTFDTMVPDAQSYILKGLGVPESAGGSL